MNKKIIMVVVGVFILIGVILSLFVGINRYDEENNKNASNKIEKNTGSVISKEENEYTTEESTKDADQESSNNETETMDETEPDSESKEIDEGSEQTTGKKEETTTGKQNQNEDKEEETKDIEEDKNNEEIVISPFEHPGILHSKESFDYMKKAVSNHISPNIDTWNVLLSTGFSDAYWNPRAVDTVIRGGNGDNISKLYIDVARAYQCALIWKINGSAEHGMAACRILNAWSATLKTVTGNADRYLASGLFGYQLANVSEIMREHPAFNVEQMQNMLLNVFYYPLNERFLVGNQYGNPHNDAYFQNYWANWDLCNMASAMAIGIFCDNEHAYNVALDYFKNGIGNGSIYNAIPYVHKDGTAQWQESGRDQGHSNLGVGLMACICEMAWNQGDDLYGWADNRFLKAAEYVAKYNNNHDVAFSEYEWGSGRDGKVNYHTVVSGAGRGEVRPIWSMIYNHYVNRKGMEAPNVAERLTLFNNAEYGAGGHATSFDQPGWGTLTFAGNIGKNSAKLPEGNIKSGKYRIVSVHTGKSLMATEDLYVKQCVKGSNTRDIWDITDLGGGEYRIKNVDTGMILQIDQESHANGALLTVGAATGAANQRFAFLTADMNNYRIIASNSGKAVDIPWGTDDENVIIQQWRYTQLNFQKWYLEKVE